MDPKHSNTLLLAVSSRRELTSRAEQVPVDRCFLSLSANMGPAEVLLRVLHESFLEGDGGGERGGEEEEEEEENAKEEEEEEKKTENETGGGETARSCRTNVSPCTAPADYKLCVRHHHLQPASLPVGEDQVVTQQVHQQLFRHLVSSRNGCEHGCERPRL